MRRLFQPTLTVSERYRILHAQPVRELPLSPEQLNALASWQRVSRTAAERAQTLPLPARCFQGFRVPRHV